MTPGSSAPGYERPIRGGQNVTARCSDADLFGDGKRVIDLDGDGIT
jgi:hypothetical protein